jgi:DNA-binding response OmpR family regulator
VHHSAALAPLGILVVDDDAGWTDVVSDHLRCDEASVLVVDTHSDVLATAEKTQPTLIILDLGLPGGDGLQVYRRLRTISDAHIILTAPCDAATTITGLAGADELLAKPFDGRAVAQHIRAILRRRRPSPLDYAQPPRTYDSHGRQVFGPLSVDIARREVLVANEQISLTRTEFEILATLAQRPGQVTTRQELLAAVWGPCWAGSTANIHVHIGHLRRKLGDNPAQPVLVLNVRGIGYRLAG